MSLNKKVSTVDILGTEYTVNFGSKRDFPKLNDADGYMDKTTKQIVVRDDFIKDNSTVGCIEQYQEKILRHEIIHAFRYESGIDFNESSEEQLTDWFAIQFYKIVNAIDKFMLYE